MRLKKSFPALAVLAFAFALSAPSNAAIIGFSCITSNTGECGALAPQLRVNATNPDGPNSTQIQFEFQNLGPIASSITAIYFDLPDSLVGSTIASVTPSGPGVVFPNDGNTTPPNLPGGNTISFTSNLDIDSAPPVSANGINPNESLTLLVNIVGGNIGDLVDAFIANNFRIGLHVQSIGATGGSDSLVSNPLPPGTPRDLNPVPEPSTYALIGTALLLLVMASRPKKVYGLNASESRS